MLSTYLSINDYLAWVDLEYVNAGRVPTVLTPPTSPGIAGRFGGFGHTEAQTDAAHGRSMSSSRLSPLGKRAGDSPLGKRSSASRRILTSGNSRFTFSAARETYQLH